VPGHALILEGVRVTGVTLPPHHLPSVLGPLAFSIMPQQAPTLTRLIIYCLNFRLNGCSLITFSMTVLSPTFWPQRQLCPHFFYFHQKKQCNLWGVGGAFLKLIALFVVCLPIKSRSLQDNSAFISY
jgi:hypothetical protein